MKTQSNNTPGPWRQTKHASGLIKVESNDRVICDGFAGEEANARLIAAAPELLEALKMARNGLRWYHDENPLQVTEEDYEVMAKIDAAIAKATGNQLV